MHTSFYLPFECAPDVNDPQAWLEPGIVPNLHSGYRGTAENWIYQSWARLKQSGNDLTLASKISSLGIVFALGKSLGKNFRTPSGTCLIDIVADAAPHPAADAYVVQNRIQQKYIPHSFFIPHWPQPRIIPRSPTRGDRFENIAFFGDASNLAPELQQQKWHDHLRRELGLSFIIKSSYEWNDYAEIDAIIAIRSFSKARYLSQSAVKLYNAWLAGVPFIGGHDIAYADEGNSGNNYLVATSLEELFIHLRHLKENLSFRHELVARGHHQGTFYTQEKTAECWNFLIKESIAKFAHTQVRKTPRQRFLMRQQHRLASWSYQQRERWELF